MNILDYIIVIIYLGLMIWLGFIFKKHNKSDDYFLGGKTFGWFSLCLSTMATQLSVISFVSAPAFVGLRKGGGMQWLTFEFGVPIAMIIIITVVGPTLYRSGIVSVYEFLEKRFNRTSRLLVSSIFLVSRSFATGVTIYAVGLILSSILQIPFWQTMLVVGCITVIYSLEGGMKAIVYSEVAQMIIKFLGIIIIIISGLYYIGGWNKFLINLDYNRLNVIDFSKSGFDGSEYGFFPMLFGGIFLYCSYYGTDQIQVQRLLSSKDENTLKKMLLFNGLFRFPVTLAYCFGGLILGAFANSNESFSNLIPSDKPDLMIPLFITNYLPHGLIGIIVVAIIAAGMSAYSSALNSLSAVTMEDFIDKNFSIPKKKYVLFSKLTALVWGIITMFFAFFVGDIAKTVIEAINKIGSMFYGPIFAMFILAIIGKNIKAKAANIALVSGILVNLILWLFFQNIFWFWWNAIGALVTLFLGFLISFILPNENHNNFSKIRIEKLLVKENIILMLFFILILLFSYFLPSILVK